MVSLGRGEFRFCCRSRARTISEEELRKSGKATFLNSDYDLERRQEMFKDIRHEDCASCWQLEDVGFRSPRIDQSIYPLHTTHSSEFHHLEVMLGNTCDMKCVYCSHHYSSKWAQERVEFGEFSPEQMKQELAGAPPSFEKHFWEAFEEDMLPTLRTINLIGGEPLLSSKFYQFLDKLEVFEPEREIRLGVVTNLNCTPALLEKFLERMGNLSKMFRLEINVSMEAFAERAEYIRYGLNWKRWTENMETLSAASKDRFQVHMQMAHNVMSLTSLLPLLEYLVDLKERHGILMRFHHNLVSTPAYLNPLMLPEPYIEIVRASAWFLEKRGLDASGLWGLRDSLRDGSGSRFPKEAKRQFAEFVARNDSRRGQRFEEIFPECVNFLDDCRSEQA